MRTIIEDNIVIQVGESKQDNWNILSNAKQNELWFHLDKLSSPYVVIKHNNPPNNIIQKACNLCKHYSKWNGTVKVIYTKSKNVSKGDEIGEAIIKGKPSFILL
jgi:predicted ribosome quality control (RQC) complex YloA/Tae2 family protein